MQKYVFTYGGIAGAVIILSMILSLSLAGIESENMASLQWLGYLIMIVAFSLIFIGIKRYRDRELGGVIKFSTAALLGLGMTLIASVIYVVVWEINLELTDHAFIADYTRSAIEKKEAAGVSGAELEAYVAEMAKMEEQYANPLFRVPITFLEIFPVGLLISLVAAAVLRNSRFLPAAA